MTHWLAETLVATTLLMALVLAVRPLVAAKLGARAAYLLWAAPAVRMILPPLPAAWAPTEIAPVRDAVVILAGPSSQPVQTAAVTGGGVAWATVLIGLWLGGAAFFFARHWVAYAHFALDMRAGEREGEVDGIAITRSAAVTSPMALGVFGRRVIVPADFAHRFDAREQRLALAHELVHHRRFDVAANFFALAVLALHWWNPIAHLAHRAFRIDQEAACDDVVLAHADAEDRYAYGSALFKSAMGRVPLAACAMGATATLKARLTRIVADASQVRREGHGLPVAAALVAGAVALTASAAVVEAPRLAKPEFDVAMAAPTRVTIVPTPVVAVPAQTATTAAAARPAVVAAPARSAAPATGPAPVPEPLAPPTPPTPVAQLTPVAMAVPATLNCAGAGAAKVAIRVSADGLRQSVTSIVVCRPNAAMRAAAVTAALREAREQIAFQATLDELQRARALAALDRQLARLAAAPLPQITMQ